MTRGRLVASKLEGGQRQAVDAVHRDASTMTVIICSMPYNPLYPNHRALCSLFSMASTTRRRIQALRKKDAALVGLSGFLPSDSLTLLSRW